MAEMIITWKAGRKKLNQRDYNVINTPVNRLPRKQTIFYEAYGPKAMTAFLFEKNSEAR